MTDYQQLAIDEAGQATVVRFRQPRLSGILELEKLGQELDELAGCEDRGKLVLDFSSVRVSFQPDLGQAGGLEPASEGPRRRHAAGQRPGTGAERFADLQVGLPVRHPARRGAGLAVVITRRRVERRALSKRIGLSLTRITHGPALVLCQRWFDGWVARPERAWLGGSPRPFRACHPSIDDY